LLKLFFLWLRRAASRQPVQPRTLHSRSLQAASTSSVVAMAAAMVAEEGPPDYRGLEILSPMVRGSSLPLRLCCLRYGAGLVYHGCQVDCKVLETTRVENPAFGCIDYVHAREGRAVFSTCAEERQRVIFQLGTCDPVLAVQAALHVCRDVRGIDVNMGCTAPFTTHGGMGSELLGQPQVAAEVLKALRRSLPPSCAVSCKIRMLADTSRTRDFMQLCERSGADAIAVHLRQVSESRKDQQAPAHWSEVSSLCSAVRIPILANGDFFSRECIDEFWDKYGGHDGNEDGAAASTIGDSRPAALMIARGALWNPGIFARENAPGFDEVVRSYIRTAASVGNPFESTKWGLKEMVSVQLGKPSTLSFGQLRGRAQKAFRNNVEKSMDFGDMCRIFDIAHNQDSYPEGAFSLHYSNGLLVEAKA